MSNNMTVIGRNSIARSSVIYGTHGGALYALHILTERPVSDERMRNLLLYAMDDGPEPRMPEPRVLTLEEARKALKANTVVFIEAQKDDRLYAGVRMDGTDYFTLQNDEVLDITDLDDENIKGVYGHEIRIWSEQPTEEQRKGVKWE